MNAILANQCRIAIKLHMGGLWAQYENQKWVPWALLKRLFLAKLRAPTNNVAQHVQWMRSGPSCPSDTDEQADEKPQTSSFEFWSLLNDKN